MSIPDGGSRPVPDPTVLTTEQLLRAIADQEKLLKTLLEGSGAVVNERFESVATQFGLIERQRVELKKDTKDAVDAALAAAKEAVAKNETSTKEQIAQLAQTFSAAIKAVEDKYDDAKDRLTRIESLKQGGKEQLTALYAFAAFLLTVLVIGGILAAAGVFK